MTKDIPSGRSPTERPPRCSSERERELLRGMCVRANTEFTEWECSRLLTEFKRNLTQRQWVWLRDHPEVRGPEDALRLLILIGFENRRLQRMRLRGRGRDRVWAEPKQQRRLSTLLRTDRDNKRRRRR